MTYDLTGPTLVTLGDVAQALSELTGRTIAYQAETLEQAYASRASYGVPHWEVAGRVRSYAAIAAGDLELVSDDVERITGKALFGLSELADGQSGLLATPAGLTGLTCPD
jgi:NAD(P)H dehydrogenase (quinone)